MPTSRPSDASGPVLGVLLEHWDRILGRPPGVDPTDVSFFEAGGNSIAAFRLATALTAAGWSVDVADLFDDPTPRRLATMLVAQTEENRS